MRRRRKAKQLEMTLNRWGGRRAGAGRKRVAKRRRVSHRTRPKLASRYPVHITMRVLPGLPRLRGFKPAKVLSVCFARSAAKKTRKGSFRICEFSVQGNHLHLICEAQNADALARGVQGFKISVAKRMNGLWKRRGTVFEDRYHSEQLRSPRQVRNALCYVLQNARRHGEYLSTEWNGVDPFSSSWHFGGWKSDDWRAGIGPPKNEHGPPVAPARTWLLSEGWRCHGLIGVLEVPAAGRS